MSRMTILREHVQRGTCPYAHRHTHTHTCKYTHKCLHTHTCMHMYAYEGPSIRISAVVSSTALSHTAICSSQGGDAGP